jgi:adenosylmethionine-8-amino-7-oxononanoate aminotransferase
MAQAADQANTATHVRHRTIAPPFIISTSEVDMVVDRLGDAIDAAVGY